MNKDLLNFIINNFDKVENYTEFFPIIISESERLDNERLLKLQKEGSYTFKDNEWENYTKRLDIIELIKDAINSDNPQIIYPQELFLSDLIDLRDELPKDTQLVTFFKIFDESSKDYLPTSITIFARDNILINSKNTIRVSLDEFREMVFEAKLIAKDDNSGLAYDEICVPFPSGKLVEDGKVFTERRYYIKELEYLKEVEDRINVLEDKKNTLDRLEEAYNEYINEPNEKNKLRLMIAYQIVPQHRRAGHWHPLDPNEKEIREIIFGDLI